jgi:uncharacterized protein (TIGR02421 family)
MWATYKEKLKQMSERLVEAQRQIRVIDAVRWDQKVLEDVRRSKFKELPKVDYEGTPLGYDPDQKVSEFQEIIDDLTRELGTEDALVRILLDSCREYQSLVRMLQNRGKPEFYEISRRLYGSPQDNFFGSDSKVKDLGVHLYNILSQVQTEVHSAADDKKNKSMEAHAAMRELEERFSRYFVGEDVKVLLESEMVADASASAKTIKLRQAATFTGRDIDILEVHEGWVHMGTTINGLEQRIAKWLHKGPPRVTATQEGLAVLMEIFSFVTFPRRARKINDRVLAISKAEDGADFLEVVEYFRTEGYDEDDCLIAAQRVFRGGDVRGKYPLTKDISYCKGFVENYNFIRACIQSGRSEIVPFLFAGKVNITDVPVLYQKHKEGLIDPPKFLPPMFRDLNSLIVWMSFSNFLSAAGMASAQEEYKKLIQEY